MPDGRVTNNSAQRHIWPAGNAKRMPGCQSANANWLIVAGLLALTGKQLNRRSEGGVAKGRPRASQFSERAPDFRSVMYAVFAGLASMR
jgi:hypothetical protein